MIVERLSGIRLDKYIDNHIVRPLDLKAMGLSLMAEQECDFFVVHAKDAKGDLTPFPEMRQNQSPEVMPGGSYLTSTSAEYAQFLPTALNNGTNPITKTKVLEEDIVQEHIFTDWLSRTRCSKHNVGVIFSPDATMGYPATLMPGVEKGWSCGSLMINKDPLTRGRNAGSAAWAGLGNCYYWIDPVAGKLGFVTTALLPFMGKDVLGLFDALERAVYGKPFAKEIREPGSNFVMD